MTDRPYVRRPSPAPPPPDGESTSAGVHCFRWTKRCDESRRLHDTGTALKALLASRDDVKGGAS